MNRKNFWRVTQAVITILLLFLLFRRFSWARFWNLYQQLPLWFYAVSLLVVFGGQLLYAFKWDLVLKGMGLRIGYGALVRHYLIAVFFNNFLPSAIGGDTSKIYYLGRQEGYFRIGASVFMDRFLGFLSMSTFATCLSWSMEISSPAFIVGRNVLSIVMAGLIALLIFANLFSFDFIFAKWAAGDGRLAALSQNLRETLADIRKVSRSWWTILGVMGVVLVYYSLTGWVYSTFIFISSSQVAHFWNVVAVLLGIGVLANIPITVNGIGLREQLHYLLFASLGISKEVSVAMSLLIFSNFLVVSLIGFFLWLRPSADKPVRRESKGSVGEPATVKTSETEPG